MEREVVNNDFYNDLNEKWYTAYDHPVALLRAENAARMPWMAEKIEKRFSKDCSILDVGCGAGFLSNALAEKGFHVVGVDLSETSLQVAKNHDSTKSVSYMQMNAEKLSFPEKSFDVVAAMDLLEHVSNPSTVIEQAALALKPGGLFFFHTFNRTWLSWVFAQKGIEWCVANAPKNLHLYRYFIKPTELKEMCLLNGLTPVELRGLAPCLDSAFFKMLVTRRVPTAFRFKMTSSLTAGYLGMAIKNSP